MLSYQQIYNQDYFQGKNSFFWRVGYGGYGKLSQRYFNNLFHPLKKYMDKSKKGRVLDVGCAYGFMLERFPQNFQKFGVDVSSFAINKAKKRLPEAQFKIGGIEEKIPFQKNLFDLIICNDVLEHLESPKKALVNITASLKSGGILYLTTPNYNFIRKTFFVYPDAKEHHISLLPHQTLLQLLNKTGLKILEHWTFIHLFFYLRINSNFGIESAVICEK